MSNEGNLGLTSETITELPIESLALAVLQNYQASKSWHRDNWLQGAERSLGRGPHMYALAEAWSWLESKASWRRTPINLHLKPESSHVPVVGHSLAVL